MSAVAKSRNYEEFKAKREEEKKARQKRIEERLATIASVRTKKIKGLVTQKENIVVAGEDKKNVNSIGSTHSVLKKTILGQNYVRQNKKTIVTIQSKSKLPIVPTKPNTKEIDNHITYKQNLAASKSSTISSKTQPPRPNATAMDDRRKKLEMWRLKKIEDCNKDMKAKKTASLPIDSKKQPLKNKSETILLPKPPKKELAIEKGKEEAKKRLNVPKTDKLVNLQNLKGQTRKRFSLSSKHLAEQKLSILKKVEKVILKDETKKNVGVIGASSKVTRPNEGYSIEIKGKTPVVKALQKDISKSLMKEKLNVWLKTKGKSPSVCKRHMCCYGLQSGTPIRPTVPLQQSKTAVKECKKIYSQELQKVEPATESKVIVRRKRIEVEGGNIFRSSDIFLKCKEVSDQQKMHFPCEDGDTPACETPMKKHFIVTPVRRSTRKSCVPMSLKDHDMIIESMDELPAEAKHQSIFKPNKCLTFAPGVGVTPERKQLDFDDV